MRVLMRTLGIVIGSASSLAAAVAIVSAATVAVNSPPDWTQFRLQNSNNVAMSGTMEASWQIVTGGTFSSSPTLAGGMLYIGDNNGLLTALDPKTGRTIWTYRAANPLMSAPIVFRTAVIVGEGDENSPPQSSPSHPLAVGNPPSALIALDRRSGRVLWKVKLPGSGMPTPAIIDGMLVHHNGAGHVVGVDPESGKVLWDRDLHSMASMVAALPVPGGRFVTTGVNSNAVWLLSAKDGSVVWKSTFSPLASGLGDCPPVSDGTRVYCNYVMPPTSATPVQTERVNKFLAYAIDLKTGKHVWDVTLESGMLPVRNEAAVPLLADGLLYMGSSVAPAMHALDPKSGATQWTVKTHGPVKGGIVDAGGTLYFGDLGGYLWAVNAKTGAVVGVKNMHSSFNVGSPIVAGRTLIIGTRGGSIVALPLSTIRASRDT